MKKILGDLTYANEILDACEGTFSLFTLMKRKSFVMIM